MGGNCIFHIQIPHRQTVQGGADMTSLSRELVFLILQFLDEEKFKETVHKLEQESGYFFNMKYFEDQVQAGDWEEVERYLSGFTKVDDNRYSMKIFFEIRKQKYLEALDKQDRAKAVDILVKDLKVFSSFNEELFKEITQLLTLENFRENEQLSKYGESKSARNVMLMELKKLIEANPHFRDKLQFPGLKASRLRTLINQSLNWQHQLCKNPRPNPDIKTLFVDHTCAPPNGARAPTPSNNPLVGALPKGATFPIAPHGVNQLPFQPTGAPPASLGWMASPNPAAPHPAVAAGPVSLTPPPNAAAFLKRPRTPPSNGAAVDYQSADSEHLMRRIRTGQSDEVGYSGPHSMYSQDDLPKTVAKTLNQGSNVMSMDFHPQQQTILLVGTNVGDIAIWEVASREKLAQRTFKVWDISACSMPMQAALLKEPAVSVNRCIWSPDGQVLGVAFSKHVVHIYSYHGANDLRQHLEIDAHVGGVNDIAFSHPSKQLCIITCGDDKTIKVWDAAAGRKQYTFEGHEAPVYSVCPHHKESIQFIFSTAIDGKIKAWLYDLLGSRVDYDAPGLWCTTMAYSADGARLFSCGTSKEGESFLVEWNESEGAIKRTYSGFRKRSLGVVQFDTTKNRFLAAGDEFLIKFWDMDNTNILTTTEAEGGLPASPRLRFNKDGNLLAVTTNDNGIKILANSDGLRMIRMLESRAFEATRLPTDSKAPIVNMMPAVVNAPSSLSGGMDRTERLPPAVSMNGFNSIDSNRTADVKPRLLEDSTDKNKNWKLTEITDQVQCKSLRLPDAMHSSKVARLIYTNSGIAVLALASNALHKLWKWPRNERNPSGKSTTNIAPQMWQPASGIVMTNDISDTNPEEAVACIALSKNDSYVMSASGGKVSLFNMMTFKVMTTFMAPPPAATFLAFHPQDNNIIAIGMEDSTIQIYNVRVDEVKSKLKGHQKKITGLAFSHTLNMLVSSGADAQLCLWSIDGWEKRKSKYIQVQAGRSSPAVGDTRVQFHNDQVHLLVVHESQLAIYEASKLDRMRYWTPHDSLPAPISSAIYSCDSLLVFASFCDGAVGVFDAESLRPRCRIAPSAYLGSGINNVYPLVIASHPSEPNQFALGMTDGGIHVIEPSESEGKWGVGPPPDNGTVGSNPTLSSQGSEPAPR
ncbi:protein TOPLESS-RELATED PROTEIN 2 isoform X1 [Cryptomeria japonica]|uniref:protein TOPLESS-RELATED PROTEIN 2 isoform X1 n=2 Tax=Cryptomeria japonica TaxID=3369 RepID=UPI0027DA6101|nr:protein TOPLESS-RELATED PROTEIN 2 isoform X1 [Cryptomeria japonica]